MPCAVKEKETIVRLIPMKSAWPVWSLAWFVVLLGAQAQAEGLLREQVLVVAMGGHEVGTTQSRDVQTAEGFRFERSSDLSLKRGALTLSIKTHLVAETDAALRPRRYRFEKRDSSGVLLAEGRIEGGTLVVRTQQGDGVVENRSVLPPDAVFASAFEHFVRGRLGQQASFERPVILEEMGAIVPTQVSLSSTSPGEFEVRTTFAGLQTVERVDAAGQTIFSETPALGAFAYPVGTPPPASVARGAVDVLAKTTWPAPRLGGPLRQVRYRVHTPDAPSFRVPEDQRQRVVQRTAGFVDVEVTRKASTRGPLDQTVRPTYLEATAYEAITHPALQAAARAAVGDATTTREKVKRLVNFVYTHVEAKALDRGYAPALTTLESKRGDCTEHSVLLSALLRSQGIPTRLVDGVVVDGGRAGYHEWVEVQVDDEGFVPADPTFGEFPASPARLKLAEGASSPEGLLALSIAAGRLLRPDVRIEVLHHESQ